MIKRFIFRVNVELVDGHHEIPGPLSSSGHGKGEDQNQNKDGCQY